jgi:hypothetical protein
LRLAAKTVIDKYFKIKQGLVSPRPAVVLNERGRVRERREERGERRERERERLVSPRLPRY